MDAVSQHHYPLNCATGRWTMLATILASSMAFIDSTALNVVLPSLQEDLSATGAHLFWVLNSYLLMLAALIIVAGSLGDKLGRVKIFKLGILIFTIGSILCGLSPTISSLIIFRAIQGIGGAMMIPGSLSIISAVFSNKEKGKAIGTWSAVATMVTICGPVLGGALADSGLWRFIFYINIPLGLLSLYALQYRVPESYEPGASKVDWFGAVILVLGLGLLTFGFLQMPEFGYSHWIVWMSLATGFLLLIMFIIVEFRISQPMIPMIIFKNNTFSGVNLLSFFLYAALGAIMLFLSLNMIQIQGYSQFQAGLTFLPFTIIMGLLSRKMGALTDRYGARTFLILGPTITAGGMLWLSLIGITSGPSAYWVTYFPGVLVFAAGMAITVVPLTTTVMSSVDERKSGIASGINNSVTRISGTFMNAILGALTIYWFSDSVASQLDLLPTTQPAHDAIMSEVINLGEASAPEQLSPLLKEKVDLIFKQAFIATYKLVGMLSAALAFLSALIALIMIAPKGKKSKQQVHEK